MSTIAILEQRSYFLKIGDEALDPRQKDDADKITTHLSKPEVSIGLIDQDWAEAVPYILKALTPAQQVAILSVPSVMFFLTTHRSIGGMIGLVKAMESAQQAAVLSAPYAVLGLSNNGQGAAVVNILKALTPEQQVAVLSAKDAVRGLSNNRQGAAVVNILKALTPEQEQQVASAEDAQRGSFSNPHKACLRTWKWYSAGTPQPAGP